jgi:hypothetical protein
MAQAVGVGRLRRSVTTHVRPHVAGELVVVVLLLVFYDWVRSKAAPRRAEAIDHGFAVLHLEKRLRLNWEHWANHQLEQHHRLRWFECWYYQLAHIATAMTVLVACYVFAPRMYRAARNTLVATNVVGLIVFVVYPVGPPRLLPGTGFIDTIPLTLGGGSAALPEPDQYAAMPSLHLAWATWVAFAVWAATRELDRFRWLRVPATVHPLITTTAVVSTANHYVLDVLAGVVLTLVAWAGSARFTPAVGEPQMIARRMSTANTQPAGTNGNHTVSSRYATTAPTAPGPGTPTATSAPPSSTSNVPSPPGAGTSPANPDTVT